MKPKTLLILSLLTAALGAFVYFVERDLPSTDEKKELETKVLTLDADEVTALTLRSGDRKVRLERVDPAEPSGDPGAGGEMDGESEPDAGAGFEEPEWRLIEPLQARADAQEVQSFLGELTGLRIERTLEDVAADAAGFGDPRAEVVLRTAGGETTLQVGVEVPLSEDSLVRVSGAELEAGAQRVVQTGFDAGLLETVAREAGSWRDKRLFFARRSEIDGLSWTDAEGRRVLLSRRGDGERFWIESPIQDRADADKVRGLLSALTGLEASSFAEGEAPFEAAETLQVFLAGEELPWTLELADGSAPDADAENETVEPAGAAGDGDGETRLARADGQLVRLPEGVVTRAVGSAVGEWRSKAWTHLQVFEIEEAIFRQPGEELLSLRRHDSDWLRATGEEARVSEGAEGETPGEKVPYTAASNVLYSLAESSAAELVADPAGDLGGDLGVDLSEPVLGVTLVSEDGEETLELFGEVREGTHHAARTGGRDAVLLLPKNQATELLDALRALRQAEVAEPEPEPESGPDVLPGDDETSETGETGESK